MPWSCRWITAPIHIFNMYIFLHFMAFIWFPWDRMSVDPSSWWKFPTSSESFSMSLLWQGRLERYGIPREAGGLCVASGPWQAVATVSLVPGETRVQLGIGDVLSGRAPSAAEPQTPQLWKVHNTGYAGKEEGEIDRKQLCETALCKIQKENFCSAKLLT